VLSNLTSILTQVITNFYISTGLLGIALAMAIESCCIPLPSEIVMPIAGALVASGTILRGTPTLVGLLLVALAGAIGCVIGSTAAYWIGYKGGRPLMLKYGRYVLISQHDADKADQFFQRWGSPTAFFSRLLPVVRTYISLPAGISKMPFVKFLIYSFLGSLPWCLLLAYVGSLVGAALEHGKDSPLSPIFHDLDIVIVVALVVLIALYIWRHVSNDRKARAAHAAEANAQQNPPAWPQQAQPQPQWGQPAQQQQWNQAQSPQFSQLPQQPQQQLPQQQWSQQQWNPQQPQQPQQQQWSQPQQPSPQQFPQQQQWGQPQQQPPQQFPQQQQWGQPQQPQPGWGQPPQSPQPWPSQTNNDPMAPRR